jgi:hypothetical protein
MAGITRCDPRYSYRGRDPFGFRAEAAMQLLAVQVCIVMTVTLMW